MPRLLELLRQLISSVVYRGPAGARRLEMRALRARLRAYKPPLLRPRGALLLPALAARLLQLSRALEPLRRVFDYTLSHHDRETGQRYADWLIEARLPSSLTSRRVSFVYKEMRNRIPSGADVQTALKAIGEQFERYIGSFGGEAYAGFDEAMTQTLRLASLCRLELDPLLKRFDPRLDTARLDYRPAFGEVAGEEVMDALLDLYFILAPLQITPLVIENVGLLAARLHRGKPHDPDAIVAALERANQALREALPAPLLLDVIRAVRGDPAFVPQSDESGGEHLADFKRRVTEQYTRDADRLAREADRAALEADVKALFEGGVLLELQGYSDDESTMLLRRGMDGYDLVFALRVLKSFAVARYENHLMDPVKELLLAGSFCERPFQQELSGAALACDSVRGRIEEFEAMFADGARFSSRVIHRSLDAHRLGKTAVSIQLRRIIRGVNKEARAVLEDCRQRYDRLATLLDQVVEDSNAKGPQRVSNIRLIAGERNAAFIASLAQGCADIRRLVPIIDQFSARGAGAESDLEEQPGGDPATEPNEVR